MKNLLFPRWCRKFGFMLLLVSAMFSQNEFAFLKTAPKVARDGIVDNGTFTNNNLSDEVGYSGIVIALFMIGFAQLREEDEYTIQVRLHSLNLSFYISYILLLIMTFLVYGLGYLFLLAYSLVALPALYIIIFNYNLYVRPILSRKTV